MWIWIEWIKGVKILGGRRNGTNLRGSTDKVMGREDYEIGRLMNIVGGKVEVKCGNAYREVNGGMEVVKNEKQREMDEGGRVRQRGNHVLSQWDNDVSKRDQAVKMGNCLSSSLKCPLPDPFR